MFYCFSLFLVLLFSVATGWERTFESQGGKPVKDGGYLKKGQEMH